MPTRIVLDDPPRSPQLSQRGRRPHATGSFFITGVDGDDNADEQVSLSDDDDTPKTSPQATESKRHLNVGFGSSILRELAVRSSDETTDEQPGPRLTSDDIRASPRFVGYLFSMIAASVLLVSVVQFYKQDTLVQEEVRTHTASSFFGAACCILSHLIVGFSSIVARSG